MRIRHALLSVLLLLGLAQVVSAASQPYKDFVKSIQNKYFVLKANEGACNHTYSEWDSRSIFVCTLTRHGNVTAINGAADWEGKYFVSGRKYRLKSSRLDKAKDTLGLKLWCEPAAGMLEDEIQIEMPEASRTDEDGLEATFFGVFLRPSDNLQTYEASIDKKLIENYLDPEPELSALPIEDREKILKAIRMMGFPPQPKLERVGQDLFIPADFIPDSSVYNDLRVTENQRIATTIEKQLKDIRLFAEQVGNLPVIRGIRFEWLVYHKDLTDEEAAPTVENIEFLVPLQAVREFTAGNLSVFELVQKSLLRADGIKVTLTSFDPIGSE